MDVLACLLRVQPGWKGAVWGNSYAGIKAHELETREIPALAELEAAWIEIAREQKKEAVNALREEKITLGVPYTFPDGQSGTIQTRDEIDIRNIQTNVLNAMALTGQAVTLQFRDEADTTHEMTAEQMIAMGIAVGQRGSNIYIVSWAHKDAIDALTTAEEIEAYDFTTGWPG